MSLFTRLSPTAYFNFGVSLDQPFSPTTYFNFGVSLDQTFNPTTYFNFGVSLDQTLSIQQHISSLVSLLTRLFFIPTTYLKCLPNMLSGTWEDQCYLPLPLSRCHKSPDLSFCIDFCTVWVCNALLSDAPKHHLDTLQKLQNKTLFISQSVSPKQDTFHNPECLSKNKTLFISQSVIRKDCIASIFT